MTDSATKRPCHHCGRLVALNPSRQVRSGKYVARHKCPHGVWCSASDPKKCVNNRSHSCEACRRDMHATPHPGREEKL